jgi:transposase InsO family protein
MMYPLVRELAADGVPVAVTCRVLDLARQPYYRWLAKPVGDAELLRAYRANALFDGPRDDPEFGYRFLADEAREAGRVMAERTAWRICSLLGWFSAFGKKRGRNGRPGPPVHDDLWAVVDDKGRVRHAFTADAPNQLWLSDLSEHRTGEGKLYLCAIKDAYSNRIVGYSIDNRMKSRIAVSALNNAVARRGDAAAACYTPTAGRSFEAASLSAPSTVITWSDRWDASARPATTPRWRASSRFCKRTSLTGALGTLARSCGSRS